MGKGTGSGRATICPAPKEAWETAKEWGKNVLGCICCCLCTGPILTLVGIIFLLSAIKDTRGNNIKTFNTGVVAWNAGARATWAGRVDTFSYPTRGGSNGTTPVTFATTQSDPITKPTESKVTAYEPLLFVSASPAAPATWPTAPGNGSAGVSISTTAALGLQISGAAVGADTMPVFKLVTVSTGTSGTTGAATSSGPAPAPSPPTPPTYRQEYTSTVCMMIDDTNSYFSTGGCFGFVSTSLANGVYATTSCGGTISTNQNTVQNCFGYAGFSVQLRSKNDPLVQGFFNKACGSFPKSGCSFGVSRAFKITVGVLCGAIGVVWTCCVYGGLYAVILYFMNKK